MPCTPIPTVGASMFVITLHILRSRRVLHAQIQDHSHAPCSWCIAVCYHHIPMPDLCVPCTPRSETLPAGTCGCCFRCFTNVEQYAPHRLDEEPSRPSPKTPPPSIRIGFLVACLILGTHAQAFVCMDMSSLSARSVRSHSNPRRSGLSFFFFESCGLRWLLLRKEHPS